VVTANGEAVYLRYDTNLFRKFYATLLASYLTDLEEMSNSEKAEVTADENLLLTLEVTQTADKVLTYKFYRLSSTEAYVTLNGEGMFGFNISRVKKIIADSQRFFANELIDYKADN